MSHRNVNSGGVSMCYYAAISSSAILFAISAYSIAPPIFASGMGLVSRLAASIVVLCVLAELFFHFYRFGLSAGVTFSFLAFAPVMIFVPMQSTLFDAGRLLMIGLPVILMMDWATIRPTRSFESRGV